MAGCFAVDGFAILVVHGVQKRSTPPVLYAPGLWFLLAIALFHHRTWVSNFSLVSSISGLVNRYSKY